MTTASWLAIAMATIVSAALAQEGQTQSEEIEELEEIVVSASRIELKASEVGSAVTVITAEEIERRGDRYVSDILRDVPGLAVNRTGSFGAFTQIRIRGAEANQTLVVIDGVEVNNPAAGSEFDFGSLLVDNIERIEVLRGSQSALWGSDAIGGVINIITKKGQKGFRGFASASAGSFATHDLNAGFSGGGERYRFAFDASRFSTNGISHADEDDGNPENDGHTISQGNVSFGVTPIENLDIDFTGRYTRSFLETDGSIFNVSSLTDLDNDATVYQRYGRANVAYDLFGGAWSHRASVAVSDVDSKNRSNNATSFTSEGDKLKLDYETTYRFETESIPDAEHAATLLLEHEKDTIQTSSMANEVDIKTNSIAGEYNLSLFDDLHLSLSGRFDDSDNFEDEMTYRVTAAYNLRETGTRFHSSYGTGVKNPSLTELFGFTGTFVGNPDLEPEKSKSWDFGVEQGFFEDRLVVDLTYFNSRVTNLITGSGNTAVNLSGTSPAQGIEVSADAEVLDNLNLIASYTYTNAETADGTEQVRRPRHIASLNVNYRFLEDRANVNLGIDYNGDQKDTRFSPTFARSIVGLDSYTLVNVNATYDIHENVQLFARGENLLNEDYEEVFGYGTPGVSGFAGVRVDF
ncbi:TonB-dependent receptor plug domain-containing protein [Kiloniella sp. b19]|uniref:TonB-dependent receptor plug domain-containing protein n=1 Tax=Kiloniella sp. GXU_MW_B19 TaxID=3141326 RepID=UPI0031DB4C03